MYVCAILLLNKSDKTISTLIFPYGLVVRIPAFHVGGPGSIPGVGTQFLLQLHPASFSAIQHHFQ